MKATLYLEGLPAIKIEVTEEQRESIEKTLQSRNGWIFTDECAVPSRSVKMIKYEDTVAPPFSK